MRLCHHCLKSYHVIRWDQKFCSPKCKQGDTNREMTRGRRIYAMAYHWRRDRTGEAGKASLREMCREISRWIEEDRILGREPPRVPEVSQMRDSRFLKV